MRNEEVIRLFDTYSDDLYRFAVSYVGSKQDAEDIVQDVFVKLLEKHIPLRRENEKSYLMTMTANRCKNHLKSKARLANVDLESAEWKLTYSDRLSENDKILFEELMKLEKIYYVPIYLHYFAGYSYKEIARILKLSESAVAMRISRGKEQMRIRLEEQE
ncbi:MAG: RNA polymerase sigma factor [Clostridiales bacterium]|nr:RNA polymerase sigma factor [Clostridiales bacterium]